MDVLKSRAVKENDAVMFDIDDTLIFTDGTPNTQLIKLLYFAKSLGYRIVIITARPSYALNVQYTQKQLSDYGIRFDTLAFTTAQDKGLFKRTSQYNYILSVGDLDTDLTESMYALKVRR